MNAARILCRLLPDVAPTLYKRFGPRPIVSSRFGFDPISTNDLVRDFYERWHRQGGQSARDYAGIMRRARDHRDLRSEHEREAWQMLDWQLRQNSAWLKLKSIGEQKKVKVIQFHSTR